MLTTSVAVVPPEPIRRRIDEVRRRFDKVWADVVLGHVSLMRPLKRVFTPAEVENIKASFLHVPPFTARSSTMEALTSADGLYLSLRIDPEEPFLDLHRRLVGIFGEEASFISFHPHVTVGSFINGEALARAYVEIKDMFPQVEFFIDGAYQLVVETDAKPSSVREVSRFEFGRVRR